MLLPALIIARFLLLGFGYGLSLALNNVFCANLAGATVILGAAHGSYGIGGKLPDEMLRILVIILKIT